MNDPFDEMAKCVYCGKEFLKQGNQKYFCSKECSSKYRYKAEPIHKVCPICKKAFETKSPRKIYCSSDCSHIANVKRQAEKREGMPIVPCRYCGKPFKKNRIDKVYCSKACSVLDHNGHTRPPREKPNEVKINDLNKEAREHGMSYGLYVAYKAMGRF